jgi:hypothetical protein
VIKKLENSALDPAPGSVEQFNATIRADYEKYGKLIRMTGAKIE